MFNRLRRTPDGIHGGSGLGGATGGLFVRLLRTPDANEGGAGGAGSAGDDNPADKDKKGAGDKGAGGGSGGPPSDPSYKDAQKLIRERDAAKAATRAITEALGLEVGWEDDAENPGKKKPVISGLDQLKQLREQAEESAEAALKKKGDWESRKQQLADQHKRQVDTLNGNHRAEVQGLTDLLKSLAVVEPLKAALAAEGAVDDEDAQGNYSDLVALLLPRFKVEVDKGEDGKYALAVNPVGDDGKPLLDGKKGEPLTTRQFVAAFLDKKEHFRQANFRRGPGAGGAGGRTGLAANKGGAGGKGNSPQLAAAQMFGRSIEETVRGR